MHLTCTWHYVIGQYICIHLSDAETAIHVFCAYKLDLLKLNEMEISYNTSFLYSDAGVAVPLNIIGDIIDPSPLFAVHSLHLLNIINNNNCNDRRGRGRGKVRMAFQVPCNISAKPWLSPSSFNVSCIPFPTSYPSHHHTTVQLPKFTRPFFACDTTPTESKSSSPKPQERTPASDTPSTTTKNKKKNDDKPSLAPPPNTFFQAITQAQTAVNAAIAAGERLLEIEFPPLPTSDLESPAIGAYEVSDANLRLAVDFAKRYADEGKKIVLSFPDRVERDRVENDYNIVDDDGSSNIRLACLRDSRPGLFIELIWTRPEIELAVQDDDDIFIVLGASCQELPDVEKLVQAAGDKPVILFNLKLDTARGDLGLPAFPRKDLHFRFLSKALPVYYLRTRTYSRSIPKPPYVVNYSGALFRVYPGDYQVLLDTSTGSYRRLKTMSERPPLGEVRDILTEGMNLEDVSKDGEKSFLYRGYKSRTWWEDDRTKAMSNNWRS